jgi:hypothetical protein
VSVASAPPSASSAAPAPATPVQTPPSEACPLCRAPLHPEQEWCLHCGAAARTRLAAAPRWKGLIAALAIVVALSLGVLAAALVKLAGGSGQAPPAITRTVTTVASTATSTPTTATSAPTATTPGASTATSKATTTVPGAKPASGALTGTSTVHLPSTGATAKDTVPGESRITKAIRERLRKLGIGKVLPSTGTR